MAFPDDNTVLKITADDDDVGVPPYAARGLIQTITPIQPATAQQRTINGRIVDLSETRFRKYSTSISGRDQRPPVMMWPGTKVRVECLIELAAKGDLTGESIIDGRPVVEGSAHLETGYTFYRPIMSMVVGSMDINTDEWGAVVSWSMVLEEDELIDPSEGGE